MDDSDNTANEREDAARFVVGSEGRELLGEIAALPGDAPAHVLTLRKRGLSLSIASLIVDAAHARKRARARFGADADLLFFTGDALAQATSPGIAAYHARYLAPLGTVADLGCGIGMDSIALARAGASRVFAIEQDAARLVFARANADALGVLDKITFVHGDAQTDDWNADAAFCDPSRREKQTNTTQTRRVSGEADRYQPPLSFIADVLTNRVKRGGCVKLSPALSDDVLQSLGGRVEFLSEARECKEACVWFGDAHGAGANYGIWPKAVCAVIVSPNEPRVVVAGEERAPLAALNRTCLYDPDPAILRANALANLCETIGAGAGVISSSDAYLAGDAIADKTLAQTYRVLHQMPYKPRALGQWLRENGYNRLIVKKRHFPLEPPALLKTLGLPPRGDGNEAVLVLVRGETDTAFLAFVCERVE